MAGTTGSPHDPSSLARLLETEARLEAVLSGAREQSQALLQNAEEEARRRIAALEAELADAASRSEQTRSADCDERLAALTSEHELAMAALRGITQARITELARWVSRQVLEGSLTGPGL